MKRLTLIVVVIWAAVAGSSVISQSPPPSPASDAFAGLRARSIGPAVTSGRVMTIAVDPTNTAVFYVGAASSGVWKTVNGGASFQPVFDSQGSFSIGWIALDERRPNVVWVGTGERNSQRSVAYGDGIYKSEDGGRSWTNVGLKNSEHIGRVVISPKDSDTVYVAAQGPLWAPGGDRGLYKTTDGGKTWTQALKISEHTGVSDVVLDPRNPDVIVATAYQRRRHFFTMINGGPESAIHRSTDGGKTWKKVNTGLPDEELGRIGLAISPVNPDIIYANVEAANAKGGIYRSSDNGVTWEKRSDYNQGSMYYGDIFADPVNVDRVYIPDVLFQVSDDGGKTLRSLGQRNMHVDNHIIWVDPKNTNHLLVGNDGGLYRSFDRAATWIFFENLPLTQFYDVDVDNAAPFYNVYGGTQDNFSLGGPSRSRSEHGILNQDWFVTQGGDGFVSRVDPEDPNTVYAELQHGVIVRYDKRTGERIGIQPQEDKGGVPLRWNWDAPFIISPHSHTRLYIGGADAVSLRRSRQFVEGRVARSHAPARSQHVEGDGQGVGTGRGREEHVDGALREHFRGRREPEARRAALCRHRRWADPRQRRRRRPLAEDRQAAGRARRRVHREDPRVAARRGDGVRRRREPSERRLRAVPAEEHRRRQELEVHLGRSAGARIDLRDCRGSRRSAAAVRRHRVRRLFQPRRRAALGEDWRPADDRGARDRDSETRKRSGAGHVRARRSTSSTTTRRSRVDRRLETTTDGRDALSGSRHDSVRADAAVRPAGKGLPGRDALLGAEPAVRRRVHVSLERRDQDAEAETRGCREGGGKSGAGRFAIQPPTSCARKPTRKRRRFCSPSVAPTACRSAC